LNKKELEKYLKGEEKIELDICNENDNTSQNKKFWHVMIWLNFS